MTSKPTRRAMLLGAGLVTAAPLFSSIARAAVPPSPGLTRYVSFVSRADGMSHQDFTKAFLAQGKAGARLPAGFVGLVLSEITANRSGTNIDGMLELWVADQAHYRRILASAAGRRWAAANDALFSRNTTYVTREHVFVPTARRDNAPKSMSLIVRKDGWDREQYMHHWLGVHAPLATTVPGLVGFVLTEIVEATKPKGEIVIPECDGIAELWWETQPGIAPGSTIRSPQAAAWFADGDIFIQRDKSRSLSGLGHVFHEPPVA